MRIFPFVLILLLPCVIWAVDVGGHISEDTIWLPENNPYHVVEDLYIDEGVTLRIIPGTIVQIKSAELRYPVQIGSFYWNGGTAQAKMIWVNGRIIAEGTEQDSILFTRDQNREFYRWGCIHLSEQSEELSIFKHCQILHSLFISIDVTDSFDGINVQNGRVWI